jgi:succinate dehydrogenase hydrophobic anchor subunit
MGPEGVGAVARRYTSSEFRKRRAKLKALAGLVDFFGTVTGFMLVLLCIVVITTLITWFSSDIGDVFASLLSPLMEALEGFN